MTVESTKKAVRLTKVQRQAIEDIRDHSDVVMALFSKINRLYDKLEKQLDKSYAENVPEENRGVGAVSPISRLYYFANFPQALDLRDQNLKILELEKEFEVALEILSKTYQITEEIERTPVAENVEAACEVLFNFS